MHGLVRLGVLLALSACTQTQGTTTTPPVEIANASPSAVASISGSEYFPVNSAGILRINVAQAVATSYFQQLRERLNQTQISPDFDRLSQAALELAELVDAVTMSVEPDPDSEGGVRVGVGVVEGRVPIGQLADILSRFEPDLGAAQFGSFPGIRGREMSVAEIAPERFLFGRAGEVVGLIDSPPRSDFMQRAELQRARTYIDEEAIVTMISGVPAGTSDDVFEPAVASHLKALGFSLQATDVGLTVRTVALVDDPEAARSIAAMLGEWRGEVLSSGSAVIGLLGGSMDFTDVFQAMTMDSTAESVTLEAQVSENAVHDVVQLLTFMQFPQVEQSGATTPVVP